MARSTGSKRWWQEGPNSVIVLSAFVVIMSLMVLVAWRSVLQTLPDVAKDKGGDDYWDMPVGIERRGELQIVRIPKCARAPISRIALWDSNSKPLWEVSGPPSPFAAVFVGLAPGGFVESTTYKAPKPGETVRLVAFTSTGKTIGIRYSAAKLREKRVVSGKNLSPLTTKGFDEAKVCTSEDSGSLRASTTTRPK